MVIIRSTIIFCFLVFVHLPFAFGQKVPTSLSKRSNAIILDEEMIVKQHDDKKYVLQHSIKIKILNKKAEDLQAVNIYYKEGSEKISNIAIIVYDDKGKVLRKIKQKEIEDFATFDGFSLVTDRRVKHWKYNGNKYPIVIEYAYKEESTNTINLPIWYPIPKYDVAVLKSRYVLEGSPDLRLKEQNLESYGTIQKTNSGYLMTEQPPLNYEKFSPHFYDIFPFVMISPTSFSFEGIKGNYDDWNGFGQWIDKSFLANKSKSLTASLKQDLNETVDPGASKKEIAKKLYKYIQKNTRYVSIALDEGGLDPMDPKKVHEVKYGDCKALSLYYSTLLSHYDIPSQYVIVHANSAKKLDIYPDYPNTFPANHAILMIPFEKDTVWSDCTSSVNPFNFLGSFTDDRLVFAVNKNGGSLIRTPKYSAASNCQKDSLSLLCQANGNTKVEWKSTGLGLAIENHMRLEKMNDQKFEDHFKDNLFAKIDVSKPENVEFQIDKDKIQGITKCQFEINNYLEEAGDYLFVPFKLKTLTIPKLPKDGRRDHQIEIVRDFSESIHLIIKTEVQFNLVEQIKNVFNSKYGSYSIEIKQIDNQTFTVDREFKINSGSYPVNEYKKIKSFFDQCLKAEYSTLNIKRI